MLNIDWVKYGTEIRMVGGVKKSLKIYHLILTYAISTPPPTPPTITLLASSPR